MPGSSAGGAFGGSSGSGAFLDFNRAYDRSTREAVKDYNNMLLQQPKIDNELRPERWAGNGFQGHIQFITYFGRAPIRAGEKLGRDIQTSTFPKENSMPLNTTQMPKRAMGSLSLGGDPLKALQAVQQAASAQGTEASGAEGATGSDHHPLPGGTTGSDSAAPLSRTVSVAGGGPTEYQLQVANEYLRKQRGHKEYLTTLKGVANTAKHRGFHENPYRYKDTLLRRNADLLKVGDGMRRTVSDLRPAGLASINPAQGTNGASSDLLEGTRNQYLDNWRRITPWALDPARNKICDLTNDPY